MDLGFRVLGFINPVTIEQEELILHAKVAGIWSPRHVVTNRTLDWRGRHLKKYMCDGLIEPITLKRRKRIMRTFENLFRWFLLQ